MIDRIFFMDMMCFTEIVIEIYHNRIVVIECIYLYYARPVLFFDEEEVDFVRFVGFWLLLVEKRSAFS